MCKIKYGEMDTHRLNISLLCCFPSLYISESCLSSADCFNRNEIVPLELFSRLFLGLGLIIQMVNAKDLFWIQTFCSEVARLAL